MGINGPPFIDDFGCAGFFAFHELECQFHGHVYLKVFLGAVNEFR
jgi:hypothetical protein